MTEQQQQIKSDLISLVNKGVRVLFRSNSERGGCDRRDNIEKSSVQVREGYPKTETTLMLVKEDTLEEWLKAIDDAEQTEAQRVLEREHEYLSPNFFKAINSYISDLQKDKLI